ncbi:hypothetical protein HNY73_007359 [Argiope bruennichi]|uniref:Uncharacterized protein n=1 Tax=Argiope bruennichi TaxID=94029 RepID=A0A8T0FEM9_ARGBR|nr:hypothetical protein HNY73_007359 [Argiope bruennichi]
MAAYRNGHMKDDTIAMVPTHGYSSGKNYSPDAIRWLDYISSCEGIEIQHSLNKNCGRTIEGVLVDGYCEETKIVYQYQCLCFVFLVVLLCSILLLRDEPYVCDYYLADKDGLDMV